MIEYTSFIQQMNWNKFILQHLK